MADTEADTEFELLEPFGIIPGVKWFRTAYKWKRDQIYAWMKTIAEAGRVPPNGALPKVVPPEVVPPEVVPPDVVPPGGDVARKILMAIYVYIRDLSLPDGALYKDDDKIPYCHIARLLNHDWKEGDETSKFFVYGWTMVPSIDPSMIKEEKQVISWWCPYDLLGLFLSLLGPAPAAANKNNFYLPLTAVYARWCLTTARPTRPKTERALLTVAAINKHIMLTLPPRSAV